ncbi:MAG: tetratricopeptide repeat protein, partial [Planctomycetota bacterium]
ADAHNNLGGVLARQQKLDKALEHFQSAVRIDPGHAGAQYNLANALLVYGDIDRAIEHYREALRIQPGHIQAQKSLNAALAKKRNSDGQ